jgi:signal transduction histidine kinase
MQVWVPQLLDGRADSVLRVAAVAHLGEVLGLIVVERDPGSTPFTDEEDTVLVELARQVGLALHNVRLDSALQASLDELEQRNAELQASRSRIVAASDESRRRIERNLHDGAQQHLVALAVKVGLVKQLLGADPDTAQALLDELRGDVQATLTELRELAHGIYPPLLRDRGLPEALRAAAGRSVLPASVSADGIGRYETDVEAAVYFCVLEAMQNVAKYAKATDVRIAVWERDARLGFEVRDDGVGFDPASAGRGSGLQGMADRLDAVGGSLDVRSAPGSGTTIEGRVPARSLESA